MKTLSDVIKTLEKCTDYEGTCDDCPYHDDNEGGLECEMRNLKEVLYYLKEYQEQQKELNEEIDYWRKQNDVVIELAKKLRPLFPNKESIVFEKELVICRDCKYYAEDVFLQTGAISFIAGHHMCSKWGHGCQTEPDGFCHMGERND